MARVSEGVDAAKEPGWMTWTDATFQALLNAQILTKMSRVLGLEDEVQTEEEAKFLSQWVNDHLWDETDSFCSDRDRQGMLLRVKSVAGYWALLAGCVTEDRLDRFTAHLKDPRTFNRHHRVPTLAADAKHYVADGGDYWCGAVWAPTNYMVLRGLSASGKDDLAYEIALNHHDRVMEVFEATGTFWENYSPESSAPGNPAKADFVGWTGLPPIAVFLEYVIGLRPIDPLAGTLLWDIRHLEEFGVDQYPARPHG